MTIKTSAAYRAKAWELMSELGCKLHPVGSNAYQVTVPAAAWHAAPVIPATPPLIRRYLGGRPGEGGTVWIAEDDDERYPTPRDAAGMWAVRSGLVRMPRAASVAAGALLTEGAEATVRAFVDAGHAARVAIRSGTAEEFTALQLKRMLATASEVKAAAHKALRDWYDL